MAPKGSKMGYLKRKVKDIKIRKSSIWLIACTMSVAAVGWIGFLVFFGRVSPIIKDTTSKNFHLYNYSLVTLPFWVYAFLAPLLYPVIGIYLLNGHWLLGVFAQISSAALAFLLGAVLNMSAAVTHVIRNLDHNEDTRNILIVGMLSVVLSLLNLVVLLITMLVYEKWMVTKNIKSMVRNIEVTLPTDSFDNTDEEEVDLKAYYAERPLPDPPYYSNVQAPIYDTVEGVEGIDDVRLPKQSSKVKKSHSRRSQRDK